MRPFAMAQYGDAYAILQFITNRDDSHMNMTITVFDLSDIGGKSLVTPIVGERFQECSGRVCTFSSFFELPNGVTTQCLVASVTNLDVNNVTVIGRENDPNNLIGSHFTIWIASEEQIPGMMTGMDVA